MAGGGRLANDPTTKNQRTSRAEGPDPRGAALQIGLKMLAVGRLCNRYSSCVFCHHERVGPLLFAHRGYHLEYPENSVEAFRAALSLGADVLEMDVRMTADDEIVVAHDADGPRIARKAAKIARIRYQELAHWDLREGLLAEPSTLPPAPVRVPRFADVLSAFPDTSLNVDIKQVGPRIVRRLLKLIAAYRASSRVLLTSFSEMNLRLLREGHYPGPIGMSRWGVARSLLAPEAALTAQHFPRLRFVRRTYRMMERPAACDGRRRMQIPLQAGILRLDTRAVIERAHRLGYRVDYWVVDDAAEAERLLDLGADGIVTDNLPAIADVFGAHVRTAAYRHRRSAARLASSSCERTSGSCR